MTRVLREDAFEVDDSDFTIVTPDAETRSLGRVLAEHVEQFNSPIST